MKVHCHSNATKWTKKDAKVKKSKEMDEETAKSVAYGDMDPVTLVKFETKENETMIVEKALRRGKGSKKGFKGKNVFANNFGGKGGGANF